MGVELAIKVGIVEIVWQESCSSQRFIVKKWLLPSILEATFFKDY
jgi:hypothetical protein